MTPRRWDIAIKWRLFRSLLSNDDDDAFRVYRWHLERRKAANARIGVGMDGKSGTDQYIADCGKLLLSMGAYGFRPAHAVPIDPDGELLGGAHRVACALALGIEQIPIAQHKNRAWAPPWGEAWFAENRCPTEDLNRIRQDFLALHDSHLLRSRSP